MALEVYRFENNTWQRQHDYVGEEECADQDRQINIPANGVMHGSFEPWKNLFNKAGKYRIVAYIEYYDQLLYKDIEMIEKPQPAAEEETSSSTSSSSNRTQPTPTTTYTQKQTKTVTINSGSITVQYDSTNIYVTSIAPASGCSYEGGRSGPEVEVQFKCSNVETQVKLTIVNGQLVSHVENSN